MKLDSNIQSLIVAAGLMVLVSACTHDWPAANAPNTFACETTRDRLVGTGNLAGVLLDGVGASGTRSHPPSTPPRVGEGHPPPRGGGGGGGLRSLNPFHFLRLTKKKGQPGEKPLKPWGQFQKKTTNGTAPLDG